MPAVEAAEAVEAAAPAVEPATVPAAAGLLEEFFRAVNEGDVEATTAAIAKGVDLSATDLEGRTALHLAAAGELERRTLRGDGPRVASTAIGRRRGRGIR